VSPDTPGRLDGRFDSLEVAMTLRFHCAAVLTALVSSMACDDGGGAGLEALAADASRIDASSGTVASTYAIAGPSAVSTCDVASASAPCKESAGGSSDAGASLYVVFYPEDLGGPSIKHPILTWGNGTGAVPAQYSVLLTHLASWGFVVVASTSPNTGTGTEMLAGEDYLVAANADAASLLYGSLDVDHVGAIGHSQGADGAAQALLAADAAGSIHRAIATLVPVELPAQEWTCFGDTDPSCAPAESFDSKSLVHGSVFFIDGSKDTLISPSSQGAGTVGEQSVQAYYDATPVGTPRAKATLVGADHNDIQDSCTIGLGCAGVGPDGYLGYITAWLMAELRGDPLARTAFAGSAPQINRDPGWTGAEEASLP